MSRWCTIGNNESIKDENTEVEDNSGYVEMKSVSIDNFSEDYVETKLLS